jgi:cytochrome c553
MTSITAARGTRCFVAAALLGAFASGAVAASSDYHGLPPPPVAARQGAKLIAVCSACHGATGVSVAPAYPNLAGQQYNYILKELEDFRSGKRTSPIMSGMAMTIPAAPGNQDLKDIAAYFSRQPLPATVAAAPAPAAQLKLGRQIYTQGLQGRGVPACAACHGLGGGGNGPMAIPALALQHETYVLAQLELFASGARSNAPGHVMHSIAKHMNKAQQTAVAAYVRQLDPRTALGIGPKTYSQYVHQQMASPAPPTPPGTTLAPVSAAPAKRAATGPAAAISNTHIEAATGRAQPGAADAATRRESGHD